MKNGIITNIDWAYIGASLANEADSNQVEFFRAFVKECLSWGTRYQAEMQLSSINLKLTDEEKELLQSVSYKEENNGK